MRPLLVHESILLHQLVDVRHEHQTHLQSLAQRDVVHVHRVVQEALDLLHLQTELLEVGNVRRIVHQSEEEDGIRGAILRLDGFQEFEFEVFFLFFEGADIFFELLHEARQLLVMSGVAMDRMALALVRLVGVGMVAVAGLRGQLESGSSGREGAVVGVAVGVEGEGGGDVREECIARAAVLTQQESLLHLILRRHEKTRSIQGFNIRTALKTRDEYPYV